MFPKLYEVNTRVWIKQFGNEATLADVPDSFFHRLMGLGIDRIWLMGIWQNCAEIIKDHAFHSHLVAVYDQVLPDWNPQDVIGSPYSVDVYRVHPSLGGEQALKQFRKRAHQAGIKIYLDFVPNHFGADSQYLLTNPEAFLQADAKNLPSDAEATFYHESSRRHYYRGKDPYFPAWTDTVQINYAEPLARRFMAAQLMEVASLCDGVRCDMAMLVVNKIFKQTWQHALKPDEIDFLHSSDEFWTEVIRKTKKSYPAFEFLAEAYWDLEWVMQQLGFDYAYDKRLLDQMVSGNAQTIKSHLNADLSYQNRLARFIENHDEERAIRKLGLQRSKAAAVIMSTIPGMKFYFDGQWEGRSIHLPVQLGRAPQELLLPGIQAFYHKLLAIIADKHFFHGDWTLLEVHSSGWENPSFQSLLAWEWRGALNHYIIIVNYDDRVAAGRLYTDWSGYEDTLMLEDLMDGQHYPRSVHQLYHEGLYLLLSNYQSHIFKVHKS